MQATAVATTFTLPEHMSDLPPDEVDRRLGIAARAHARCEAGLAFWLLEVERRALYRGFGFRDTLQYAAGRHGIEAATAYRLIRAARACERSPALHDAFARDLVAISKIDVLAPVLHGDERDAPWVERAKQETRHELRSSVQRALGLEPDDARITLTVQLTPSQWRIFQDALERCRRLAGAEIDEAQAIEYMAAELLAAPVEPDEEPARSAETSAEPETEQSVEVSRAGTLHLAASDGRPGNEAPADLPASCTGKKTEAPSTSLEVEAGDVAGDDGAGAASVLPPGTPAEREFLEGLLRGYRKRVLERDGWRCTVPGCGERSSLEVDHVKPRSRFPELRLDEENGLTLCTLCHRLKTEGLLRIERAGESRPVVVRPERWGERPRGAPA